MIEFTSIIKHAMAIVAIVDPIGCAGIFLGLTGGQSQAERKRTANIASFTMATVLVFSVIFGEKLLFFFGIGIASFQVGGGILLLLMSISMLNASVPKPKRTDEEAMDAEDKDTVAVVPLGIPLLAGPGAITAVILDAHEASTPADYSVLIGIILFVSSLTWLAFRLAVPISDRLGRTGLNIVTRLMGLILAAISVEIVAAGIKGLFPALGIAP